MSLPLALTIGEPAGIGPDLALAVWLRRSELGLPPFYLIADPAFVVRRASALGYSVPFREVEPEGASSVFADALPIVTLDMTTTTEPGRPDESSALSAIASIRRGVRDVIEGRASAVVTNPVAKLVLYQSGFGDPGQTEFLARLAAEFTGRAAKPVMMIWSEILAVVPVTIHLPLREVPDRLSQALIVETGRIVARDLERRFGLRQPRLAVAGLNPHAGEDGALGEEDLAIVRPAVEQLKAEGIEAHGPLPADAMFHPAARKGYDAALCMYHDQALIPVKTLAFHKAVNVTLGLPFIRTSPDHGTAFDLAGTGRADPGSLIAALALAARLSRSSARHPVAAA
ncbi:MAG: 4-hydroxythreonine-4-phosphate dehydrogenase PdxA [Pseudorhodoplanes sp.]|nr:4-hydroxythreonine-4-phosphate dehydrogenase PdxA [Pseudorhodoplanes sp.]